MRLSRVVAFCCLSVCLSAHAQVISRKVDDVEVAVYRGPSTADQAVGLAMISEERTIDLPGGPTTIQFEGVADAIVPQTAALEGLPTPVIESNFDYDLLSAGAVIAKSVGFPVRIVRTNRQTGVVTERRAVLRSGPIGVLLEIDGQVEALGCSGEDERLVFDAIPPNLAVRPTLSMPVDVPRGRYKLRLSYLTLGMTWAADYVARIQPDGRTLELTGWVTLTNKLAARFDNASVKVIAGELSFFGDETVPPESKRYGVSHACWPVGKFGTRRLLPVEVSVSEDLAMPGVVPMMSARAESGPMNLMKSFVAKQSDLGDYKLYSLPERTVVAANQTKQVRMLEKKSVRFERVHVYQYSTYDLDSDDETPAVPMATLRVQNKKADGAGIPLPAGTVSVLENAGGTRDVLAGEDEIQDVPVGLPVEIELGESMDVWVQTRLVSHEAAQSRSGGRSRLQVEILLGNDKSIPATIELRHNDLASANPRFIAESKPHATKFGAPQWTFNLAPRSRASLRYTIEVDE